MIPPMPNPNGYGIQLIALAFCIHTRRVSIYVLIDSNTGSSGPEGLEEFISALQSSQKSSSNGSDVVGGSFREELSQTAKSSLKTGAKDMPS